MHSLFYLTRGALLASLLLLAGGCDRVHEIVDPTEPPEGAFTVAFNPVPGSPGKTKGTFEASGAIDDAGTYTEALSPAEPLPRARSFYGIRTLAGARGTLKIEFYVNLRPTEENTMQATGGFRFVTGSGAYAGLEGSGAIDREVAPDATPAVLTHFLEGNVW